MVGGRELRVEQAALPPCTYTVAADQFTVSRQKQDMKIEVVTQSHCQWSATSSASWARVPSGAKTGTATLEVKIDDYSRSGSRSAVVAIIGDELHQREYRLRSRVMTTTETCRALHRRVTVPSVADRALEYFSRAQQA